MHSTDRRYHLPDSLPADRIKQLRSSLVGRDVDEARIVVGGSVDEFLDRLPPHSVGVVYSLHAFASLDELLSALGRLRRRRIGLCSFAEPWLNDTLADYLRAVDRLDPFWPAAQE